MSDSLPQFIDSNILIYAYDRTAGVKNERARALLQSLWPERTGSLSIQVLQEFYVVVTRKIGRPMSSETAAQIISDLSVWDVHRPDVNDILEAIQLQDRHQISFWDAMILTSARQLGCETVWSEDLNAGQTYGDLVVRNPFH